ncbi:hypothetical protein LSAT2_016696 [Lamellibrachia satsuma]|nr:hypothetical protein LSAT2_016696 [Lamellibrachia satsuma]
MENSTGVFTIYVADSPCSRDRQVSVNFNGLKAKGVVPAVAAKSKHRRVHLSDRVGAVSNNSFPRRLVSVSGCLVVITLSHKHGTVLQPLLGVCREDRRESAPTRDRCAFASVVASFHFVGSWLSAAASADHRVDVAPPSPLRVARFVSVKRAWDWSTVATGFPHGPEIAVLRCSDASDCGHPYFSRVVPMRGVTQYIAS